MDGSMAPRAWAPDHEDGHEGGGGGDREVEVTAWDRDPQEEED